MPCNKSPEILRFFFFILSFAVRATIMTRGKNLSWNHLAFKSKSSQKTLDISLIDDILMKIWK